MHTWITESGSLVGRTHKRLTCGCDGASAASCSTDASRRYLMRVRLEVVGKGALLAELHVAVGTRVRLVARVDLLVVGQRRQLAKGLVTRFALVRLRIDVGPLVVVQRAQLREAALANATLERLHQLLGRRRAVAAGIQGL